MSVMAYFLAITILRNPPTDNRHPASRSAAEIQPRRDGIRHQTSVRPILPSPVFTLITGASSGLGREMAIECAAQGRNLILVALPGRNMDVLCRSLERQFGIRALFFERDLTCSDEIHKLVQEILPKYRVNFLINNAGTGGTLPFGESSTEYLNRIIQLNITALSLLTRLLLSELQRHKESWILNVSSMAAFGPMPFKTVYPASKAFVAHFSRSLGEELKETSVKVAVLHPGPILTNPDVVIRIIRQGANGKRGLLSGRELARRAISGLEKGKRTIVPGFSNKLNRFLMMAIPDDFLVPFLARVVQKEIRGVRRAA
jgi:short-subunit dehydrogenase